MTREKTRKKLEAALWALSADPSLGYLAVTSKPELPVRDKVAWDFHWKHPHPIVAREYTVKLGRGPSHSKRVDLALLNDSPGPVVLIEFKAMIVPDALAIKAGRDLVKSLADDLKELDDLRRVRRLGLMLMVHIENVERLERPGLNKYAGKYLANFRS